MTPDRPQVNPLFDAIPQRQNTRSEYDGRPIPAADLDRILSLPIEPGVNLRLVAAASAEVETLVDYVIYGSLSQYAEADFVDELIQWLRFNKKGGAGGYGWAVPGLLREPRGAGLAGTDVCGRDEASTTSGCGCEEIAQFQSAAGLAGRSHSC